jgi:hypothetical protein
LELSARLPSARRQWVTSACQHSFGSCASNRTQEFLGRLCGWGTTNPRRRSTRQIVEIEGPAMAVESGTSASGYSTRRI